MDVRLPDGRIVRNVPEGTTKTELMRRVGLADGGVAPIPEPVNLQVQEEPKPAFPDVARSFLGQGVALGFGDEIEAGLRSFLGDETYDQALEHVRGEIERFHRTNPAIASGTEMLGAMALPIGGAAGAATTLGRVGRGAIGGGAAGAAFGFGTSEGGVANRATSAATGAAIGASLGGAAPAVVEGAIRGGRAVAGALDRAGRPIRATVAPRVQAGRDVANALEADRRFGSPGLTDQSFQAAQRASQPVANIDRGGETTLALARSAANQDPAARARLSAFADARFETQAPRIEQQLNNVIGGDINTVARRASLENQARRANKPRYDRAFKAGDRPITSAELERIAGAPAVVEAARRAERSVNNASVAEGFGAFNPRLQISDDGLIRISSKGGQPTFPNLRYWDQVKKELDNMVGSARRSGENETVRDLTILTRDLRSELDRVVPEYQGARQSAARFFGEENALEAGRNFIRANQSGIEAARRAFKNMPKAERELFAEGYAEALLERIARTGDRRSVVGMFQTPQMRRQMAAALGVERARRVEAQVLLEDLMDRVRGAVQGNSTTTRQLVELGLVGSGSFAVTGDLTTTGVVTALARGAQVGRRKLNARVSREIADLLTSGDPHDVQKAVQRVAQRNDLLQSLRALEGRLAVAGGQQGAQAAPGAFEAGQQMLAP